MFLIIILILIYHTTLALIYNDKCTQKCDFPGLVCVNDRCVCDSKTRLFWTNARCAPCPNDWTMTETACIAYYETPMSWKVAKSTCQNVRAELISLHRRDLISLIYTATDKNRLPGSMDKLGAWISAHATDYSGLGVYQWLDTSVASFDSTSHWWCKKTTANLGYVYQYDEPTRLKDKNNETEACVVYWRGTTMTEVLCLDDQFCSKEFPFACEKSESTANQYLGPPPKQIDYLNTTTNVRATIIHTVPSNVGTIIINTGAKQQPPSQTQKKISGTILAIIIFLSLFLFLIFLGGLFYYFKRHNINKNPPVDTYRVPSPVSIKSDPKVNEPVHIDTNPSEVSIALESTPVPTNIDFSKQQKTKRAGYSKQQFDEFE